MYIIENNWKVIFEGKELQMYDRPVEDLFFVVLSEIKGRAVEHTFRRGLEGYLKINIIKTDDLKQLISQYEKYGKWKITSTPSESEHNGRFNNTWEDHIIVFEL